MARSQTKALRALMGALAAALVAAPTGSAQAVQVNNLATGCAWTNDTGCSFTAVIPPPLAGYAEVFVQVEAVSPTQPVVSGALSAPTWIQVPIFGTGSSSWTARVRIAISNFPGTIAVTAAPNSSGFIR